MKGATMIDLETRKMEVVEKAIKYDLLTTWLINTAELSYAGNELRVKDVADMLKMLEPLQYAAKLHLLHKNNEDAYDPN